ncbi:ankyrin repeat-containing domain protein [Cytidiella melzeri]|nr:ankyrin repeat-containing domain protein [Cytidiella melzeri]
MADNVAERGQTHTLTPEAIQFAHRMFNAGRYGDDVLLHAVDAGLPVNMTNDEGNTLLMLAAYNGHLDLTKGLIARGADVNRVNDRGQSPLAGVVFKGYDEIATLLAENGADPRLGTPTAIQTMT